MPPSGILSHSRSLTYTDYSPDWRNVNPSLRMGRGVFRTARPLCSRPLAVRQTSAAAAAVQNAISAAPYCAAHVGILAAVAVGGNTLGAQAMEGSVGGSSAASLGEVAAVHHSQTSDAVQHFFTGGLGGCVGAAAVFPIDLVKTRLQAQKDGSNGSSPGRYSSGLDCFVSVLQEEGISGLYGGLSAQLIGVWPEKAVKLSANDFMRATLANPATGQLTFPAAILAGAFGGMCQVVFTNPLEIVKIQLQLEGASSGSMLGSAHSRAAVEDRQFPADTCIESSYDEGTSLLAVAPAGFSITGSYEELCVDQPASSSAHSNLAQVVRSIGLTGLYRGATVCACRDMVFSGIYFPLFASLKDIFAAQAHAGGLWLLLAGTLAGAPAAYFSTPMDMVKTRVQDLTTTDGQQQANPIACLIEIVQQEGWQALFTGGWARVARSAPQFGVTLLVYDSLNTWLDGMLQ